MRTLVVTLAALFLAVSCAPPTPAPVTTTTTSTTTTTTPPVAGDVTVLGTSRYTAAELAAWYRSRNITPATGSCATIEQLAVMFIEEGTTEGVRGDVAFAQSVLETGWFRHSTRVPASMCNYAGIGADDIGSAPNEFRSARIGVRAQIQHLRAYADPTVTCSNFVLPRETPRCHYVPKGAAPSWAKMGKGNWATDPDYGTKILTLYRQLGTHAGR